MFIEKYDVEVALPLYQPMQEVFNSVNSVKELKAVYLEFDVSCPRKELSGGFTHCDLRSKSRSASLKHRSKSESPSTRNNSCPA